MTDTISLQAVVRDKVGTAPSRNLRRENRVPAIIYGGTDEPKPISLSLFEVQRMLEEDAFYTSVLELKTDQGTERAILKVLDRHPVRDEPMHLDFLRVTASTEVSMAIPLSFINEEDCIGVRTAAGVLNYQLPQVTIRARADRIPSRLEVDVADLAIGEGITLSQLKLPNGVSIPLLEKGQDTTIVTVLAPRIMKEDAAIEASEEAEAEAKAEAEDGDSEQKSDSDSTAKDS